MPRSRTAGEVVMPSSPSTTAADDHGDPAPVSAGPTEESLILVAPLSGVVVPLERVPDAAFAQRMAGDGVAIDPLSACVVAPCDARVLQIHRARHAVTLLAGSVEIIVHVGLDTVLLQGAGFTPHVRAGDEILAGHPLLSFDADLVARRARSLLTPVLVANMERVATLEPSAGVVVAGRDVLMRIAVTGAAAPGKAHGHGAAVRSKRVMITAPSGLHARPAAAIAATARRFATEIRLVNGLREADARSVVSLMMLEARAGDTVTVLAHGDEAAAAVDAIAALLARNADETRAMPLAPPAATSPAPEHEDGVLRGVPASPGVALGAVFQLRHDDPVQDERAGDPEDERRALDAALTAAHLQLEALRARLGNEAAVHRAMIFAAHQELLRDPVLLDRAQAGIRAGATAAGAWHRAYTAQADRLLALTNPLLAGRAADLTDVGRRVLHLLVGGGAKLRDVPGGSILVAEELAPSDIASLDRTCVHGFCTTSGSATSHVAILARGLGVPAVAGIDPRALDLAPGTRVVLDGAAGTVRPAPSAAEEAAIAARQAADDRQRESALAVAAQPAITQDEQRVAVVANIGSVDEARRVPAVGGEGVGLLRSEFLFVNRSSIPSEDEQARTYEAVARALGPERILVIRTLDIGGDKPLPYLGRTVEANPFLGERGIRFTLGQPDLLRTQVRAILRSSTSGRVAIMFPMIAMVAEWRVARDMVERERVELGVPPIPVGIMVETPAAALLAEWFAREADFLSIGTNDLTQYTLAMDRTHPRLAPQVDALHPAVLRLIAMTVAGAHAHGRWVGVCGALAGDVEAVPVLVGLGVDELSADLPVIAAVKARIRTLSAEACRATAQEALATGDGAAVRALVARRHAAPASDAATTGAAISGTGALT